MKENMKDTGVNVTTDFSKAINAVLREKFHLKGGIYQSTKEIYTLNDLPYLMQNKYNFIATENFLNLRLRNFLNLLVLSRCNNKKDFLTALPLYKNIESNLLFFSSQEIGIILRNIIKKPNDYDKLVDCVMITIGQDNAIPNCGSYCSIIADFFLLAIE